MDWTGWLVFGFLATIVLTTLLVGARLLGLSRLDLPLLLGTMVVQDPDRARLVGVGLHLLAGQAFALAYAVGFATLNRAGWLLGAGFGAIHGAAAVTLLLPVLPTVHPRMASERTGPRFEVGLEPPGPLGTNYGRWTPMAALVAHAAYGAILGGLLEPR